MIDKIRKWWRSLPDRKPHLDVLIAFLTIPVLITLATTNVLKLREGEEKPTPSPTDGQVVVKQSPQPIVTSEVIREVTSPSCKREVGPVTIQSPVEGATVTENPVCVVIRYTDSNYCSVVWSYRINGGPWSDLSSSSVCIYNPPQGNIDFELRVQSTVSQDQEILRRTFRYLGAQTVPTPTTEPAPTQSP